MRYQITIKATTYRVVDVEAKSLEEAKDKALAVVQGPEPNFFERIEVYGLQIADEALT